MTDSTERARAFDLYQNRKKDALIEGKEVPKFEQKTLTDPDAFIKKAKELVASTVNKLSVDTGGVADLTDADFYIVWFVKVLGNWKALVSTDAFHGYYYEVTYNGAKNESYVDTYVKSDNRAVSDEEYNDAFMS